MPGMDAVNPAKAEEGVSGVVAVPTRTARKFIDAIEKVAPLDRVGPTRQMEIFVAAFEVTQRLIHAPYDISRGLVQSAVVVDVDIDVDIASRQAPQQRAGEDGI